MIDSELSKLFSDHGIVIPSYRADAWRRVKPTRGAVRGQPHYGLDVTIIATDGIHAYVELFRTRELKEIHISNFLGPIRSVNAPEQGFLAEKKPRKEKKAPIARKPTKQYKLDLAAAQAAAEILKSILNSSEEE